MDDLTGNPITIEEVHADSLRPLDPTPRSKNRAHEGQIKELGVSYYPESWFMHQITDAMLRKREDLALLCCYSTPIIDTTILQSARKHN
jgi:hypothetical protein